MLICLPWKKKFGTLTENSNTFLRQGQWSGWPLLNPNPITYIYPSDYLYSGKNTDSLTLTLTLT